MGCALAAWVAVWLLAACGGPPAPTPDLPAEDPTEAARVVSDTAWVTRVSLDVRGVRPSTADLAAAADPAEAARLVDRYLEDDRLGTRIAWIWNDTLHSAAFFMGSSYRILTPTDEEARALGWNALEVVRRVVDDDLPFTEVVTATTVPWNDPVATFWQQDPPGTGTEWTEAAPTDGRPMAGMLSVSALWLVYDADRTNLNRRRANVVSRVFACADFLERGSSFDRDIPFESLSTLSTAVRTEDTCLACHAGLDPLAAFFGGFADRTVAQPMGDLYRYSPWTADWYRGWTSPSWYGHPGSDIHDLGALIAADPRFAACAVRRVAEGLVGHPVDAEQLARWTRAFVDVDDMEVRPLVARIVASDAYRADEERVLTTEQVHSALADLTGWDPQTSSDAGWMPLSWDRQVRTLGGGTDDFEVLLRNREPGLGTQVLMTWAGRVATQALADDATRAEGDRVLWTELDPGGAPEDAEIRAQITVWYLRFLGVSPEETSVDGLLDLWSAASDAGSVGDGSGGAAVLQAIVRHPRSVIY